MTNMGDMEYNVGTVQFEGSKVVLYYVDPLGRPRTALLMHKDDSALLWISSRARTTVTIGTVEMNDDGDLYLKIPVK